MIKNYKKLRYGGLAVALTALLIAAVVLVNIIFSSLAAKHINVDIILQSIGRDGTKDVSFTVSREEKDNAIAILNDVLTDATADLQPPATNGRRLKIYYITQQGTCPPLFILFVNDETLMHFAYERYLENYFRKTFDFTGTPIKFILREKKKDN